MAISHPEHEALIVDGKAPASCREAGCEGAEYWCANCDWEGDAPMYPGLDYEAEPICPDCGNELVNVGERRREEDRLATWKASTQEWLPEVTRLRRVSQRHQRKDGE